MMIARSTAAQCPLTTTCPGALSFATAHTSARSAGPSDASAATSRACSTSRPSSAAIAPSPTGIACCIAWPRSLRRWAPSPTESACAAAKAEYSPSECPATKVTFRVRLKPPSVSRTRMTARLAAINAGWAFSVRVSSFSGPSNIKCDKFCASASSTSANSRRAGPNAAARAPPMPTACEPCPGNTNARFIRTASPHFVTGLAPAEADDVVIAVSPSVSRRRCAAHLVPRLAPQYMKYEHPCRLRPARSGRRPRSGSSLASRDIVLMPLYENVFIARQDISSAQVDALADSFTQLVVDNGGEVKKREYWGLRNLAYRMRKNRKGHYVLLNLSASPTAVAELERTMRINEDVVRYLTIRVDALDEGPSVVMQSRGSRDDRQRRSSGERERFGEGREGVAERPPGAERADRPVAEPVEA